MKQGYHYVQSHRDGVIIFRRDQSDPRGRRVAELFHRPEYTPAEAMEVAEWLNGNDLPLPTMLAPEHDGHMVLHALQNRRRANRRTPT